MQTRHNYEIDDSRDRLDFERIHGWLRNTYWSPGIERAKIERAAHYSSLVIGGYWEGVQVSYMRVVSDRATFGYLCDVYVDEAHRGKGLARDMVRFALGHPEHHGLRRWLLATRDAHSVYARTGFQPLPQPERWMIYVPSTNIGSSE